MKAKYCTIKQLENKQLRSVKRMMWFLIVFLSALVISGILSTTLRIDSGLFLVPWSFFGLGCFLFFAIRAAYYELTIEKRRRQQFAQHSRRVS